MNKTVFALTSSTLAVLAFGCQPRTKTKVVEVAKPDKVYNFTKDSYGDPIEVPIFDTSCRGQRGAGLGEGIIAEAYMGVETRIVKTLIEEEVWENSKRKDIARATYESAVIGNGRPVAICQDAQTIPANTQEGAAISMKTQAEAAHDLYETVRSQGNIALSSLESIYLNAAIKETVITRQVDKNENATETTSYATDNASFMGGENSMLISYPQSESAQKHKLNGGIPLWLVPGVFQHEFGHYIFFSLMNEGGASFTSYQEYAEKNPDLHLFQTPVANFARIAESPALRSSLTDFVRTQEFFLGSLNEGFADLWAYYTLKQPTSMFEISCFSKNRNVSSPVFYNGISKSWDEILWNKAFHSTLESDLTGDIKTPIDGCSQPIFADIHIIGAAIAHTADAVFTAAAQAQPTQDATRLKAEMSLAWLKSIKDSNEFEDLGGKASLSRILNAAVGTGMNYLKDADKTAFCAVVSSKFPMLVKRWKDAKTDNEDVLGVVNFCSL
ncbi:hypothetical protein [Oligoflexus tunisiensis]|uniref:hypothetical protein n=1 Tax=Oligoflexus tunisiensis TaxID=708132 RepID=UPI00114D2279|nr:hypothetical protein [Oligoflexus tunisiensis]